jgi:NTE family protein
MLTSCLIQVFGHVEDAFVDGLLPRLRWVELGGGQTLFEQGQEQDGVYFVISGRLRSSVREGGETRFAGDIVRGETIGETAAVAGESRALSTIVAVRDSVLVHATRQVFDELMLAHPQLPVHVARLVARRSRHSPHARRVPKRPLTVCVLAVSDGVDVSGFAERLVSALGRWGVATLETSARIDARFGAGASACAGAEGETGQKLSLWLDDIEFWHEYVVLAADACDSPWTRRCLRQADALLLLARAAAAPALHPLEERHLAGARPATAARQTLVLLHDDGAAHPRGTPAWLERRPVDAHVHVRGASDRDMARLARIVSGNAVGLVLAGGGARGFAHLGVFKALQESGIALDYVGGTSIGAVMAAYVSFDLPAETAIALARDAFASNPIRDVNLLPLLSLLRGRRLKRVMDQALLDAVGFAADMSDTWRSFFCVATNFSRAREAVLTRGHLATCVRASVSLPVALPPVVRERDLLVDGGTFNNFPTDVMARMGAGRIIGVDVQAGGSRAHDFDDLPGPFELLRDRLRPRDRRKYALPSLAGMLMETMILYSASRQQQARENVDLYLNPDLRRFGLLDWAAFDEIVAAGYRHARDVLAGLSAEQLAAYRDSAVRPPMPSTSLSAATSA